ncbi:MAG: hypothetical protein M1822_000037 [Bathelium mastoideum]|nr:MAG: hypothetical protein M1822_000037 [Bathelium mastoideum]
MANVKIQNLPASTHVPAGPKSRKSEDMVTSASQGRQHQSTSPRTKRFGNPGLRPFHDSLRPLKKPSITIDTKLAQRRQDVPIQIIPLKDARYQPKRISLQSNSRLSQHISPVDVSCNKPWQPLRLDVTRLMMTRPKDDRPSNEQNLVTPTIIVTPAKEDMAASMTAGDDHTHRPRPRSSVYSRATYIAGSPDDNEIPPLPSIPWYRSPRPGRSSVRDSSYSCQRSLFRDSVITPLEEDEQEEDHFRNERSLSTFTISEEPLDSEGGSVNPIQTEQRTPDLLYSRVSRPLPRRSCGWWDYIKTPFASSPSSGSPPTLVRSAYAAGYGTNTQVDISEPQTALWHASPSWISLPQRANSFSGAIRHGIAKVDISSRTRDPSVVPENPIDQPLFEAGEEREIPTSGEASRYYDSAEDFGSPGSSLAADHTDSEHINEVKTPLDSIHESDDREVPIVLEGGSPGHLNESDMQERSPFLESEDAVPTNSPYRGSEFEDSTSNNGEINPFPTEYPDLDYVSDRNEELDHGYSRDQDPGLGTPEDDEFDERSLQAGDLGENRGSVDLDNQEPEYN